MPDVDIDRLLRRRLNLQRYVTSLQNETIRALKPGDNELLAATSEFMDGASDRELAALSVHRFGSNRAGSFERKLRDIIGDQRGDIKVRMQGHMDDLVEREAEVTTAAMGESEPPSMRGVAGWAIGGALLASILDDGFRLYQRRVVSEISEAARTDPASATRVVRGNRAEKFKNGILFWRNERVLKPNIDKVTNGVASNASNHVYQKFRVKKVSWLATLDFRTCPRCYTAEAEGPYEIGRAPGNPMHPRCLIGSAEISAGSKVTAVTERKFDGDIFVVRTAFGKELSCTPNHPILTDGGFVSASRLNVGCNVICDGGSDRKLVIDNDHQHVPTTIEKFANTFRRSLKVSSVEVPVSAEDFHGDGAASEVAVISSNRLLSHGSNSSLNQKVVERIFIFRRMVNTLLFAKRHFDSYGFRYWFSSARIVRTFNLIRSLVVRHLAPFDRFRFALASPLNIVMDQYSGNNIPRNTEILRDSVLRFSGNVPVDNLRFGQFDSPVKVRSVFAESDAIVYKPSPDSLGTYSDLACNIVTGKTGPVFLDEIVDIQVKRFVGHVYNLETEDGFYTANGIINHNCRCVIVPYVSEDSNERGFLEDDRSLKDIPVAERDGIVGTTRDTIEQFFDRMTRQQRIDYMGPGRNELWEAGKIDDIKDLVDRSTLRELRLDELPN